MASGNPKPIQFHPMLFAPDLDTSTPGIVVDASLMYPTLSGARTRPSGVAQGIALPSAPLGPAFVGLLNAGGIRIVVGTAQHLYEFLAGVWTEIDGGQTFSGLPWTFAQSGDDTLATNGADAVQGFIGSAGTQFAPLAGNPPIAKYVVVVDPGAGSSEIAILANLASDPTGWVSSAPGNDTIWTRNVADLSAAGFLRSGPGPITGLATVRGYAVAFKQASLYQGQFVGPPFVWSWVPVSTQVGSLSNAGIVNIGDTLAFVGPDDFYTWDSQTLTAIPNALRQWFFGDVGANNGFANPNFLNTIQGHYNASTAVVSWHFSSNVASPAGTLDTYLSWNKKSGRWLVGHETVSAVITPQFGLPGMTYDQFAAKYVTYGNIPAGLIYGDPSFDPSPIREEAHFGPDFILYADIGPPNAGYIQTGDIGDPIQLTRLNRVRGIFNTFPANAGTTPFLPQSTLNTFVRRNLGMALTANKANVPLSPQGYWDFREAAGWHQLRMQFATDAEIVGFAPDAENAGDR